MSLRSRLLVTVALALLGGMTLGCLLTIWEARISVSREVDAALAVGRQTVSGAVEEAARNGYPAADLRRLVADFNGNRHIIASLTGLDGAVAAVSTLAPADDTVPSWFGSGIGVAPVSVVLPLPEPAAPFASIRLSTDPRNEVAEVWRSFLDAAIVILALCIAAGGFIWWSIGRTLQPLAELSSALESVAAGRFDARLAGGPLPETRSIAAAFNRMAGELAAARERNIALHGKLLTAQEAERADIARDLHDDIGPLLFAINVDTAAAEQASRQREPERGQAALRSIRESTQALQLRIRGIVNRLRPIGLAELGLDRAVLGLAEFWQRLHPQIRFSLALPDTPRALDEAVALAAYRILQEAVTNAVRHGRPAEVRIAVQEEHQPGSTLVVSVEDDGAGGVPEAGFGLLGMHERARAAGGTFAAGPRPCGGFAVTARLPLPVLAEATP
jgi:two-component system sensor histidine kinase UhpB